MIKDCHGWSFLIGQARARQEQVIEIYWRNLRRRPPKMKFEKPRQWLESRYWLSRDLMTAPPWQTAPSIHGPYPFFWQEEGGGEVLLSGNFPWLGFLNTSLSGIHWSVFISELLLLKNLQHDSLHLVEVFTCQTVGCLPGFASKSRWKNFLRKSVWWVGWWGAASSPGGKWAMLVTSKHASSWTPPPPTPPSQLHNYIKYMLPLPTVRCMEAHSFPVLIMVFKAARQTRQKEDRNARRRWMVVIILVLPTKHSGWRFAAQAIVVGDRFFTLCKHANTFGLHLIHWNPHSWQRNISAKNQEIMF